MGKLFNLKSADPLSRAIQTYREANNHFRSLPEDISQAEEQAVIADRIAPVEGLLSGWIGAAPTREAAIEALKLVLEEQMLSDTMGLPLVRAAIGFLEQSANSNTFKAEA